MDGSFSGMQRTIGWHYIRRLRTYERGRNIEISKLYQCDL